MSFLLDTDISSTYLRNDPVVALRAKAPPERFKGVQDFLKGATVLDATLPIAAKFGEIRAGLCDRGINVPEMDLLNGATALVHGLTMVTHNVKDYADIPGLTIDDWLIP